jgi:BASS family bile acid:Na+ symporter
MFDHYAEYEYPLAVIQCILFMLGMGATLRLGDFASVVRRPRSLLAGLAFQLVGVPLIAWGVNAVANLEAGIAVGIALIAAMPGGSLAKFFVWFGRGNVALSITLGAITLALSVVTVPLLLKLLVAGHVPADFEMPTGVIVREVCLYLLLPLIVGMTLGHYRPVDAERASRWLIRLGIVTLVLMVVGSLGSGRIRPGEYGWAAPIAIIAFCALIQQVSILPFRFGGWSVPDRCTVGIEVTMRNINLALLLKASPSLFPASDPVGDGVLYVVLFYAAVAMIAGLPFALNHRRLVGKPGSSTAAP